ncbi:MAG: hypothetical protein A2Y57_04140 [Candidatus Woykebacteria bacterium RBG_13_40_7b]|uniref:N-acetylmuramoyl-L-alanine amidase domain-containing protein n=1 Tax=Candidatus Woykebacteria bacterium RBG_13_40_7b TaxID=1802594 RepID=A0A1G1WA95_9BACT|nr:MAG: hypothetical protein A2Y57_04140 [Candidatus Woykebacteria bacterium RBG_13_40_7b]
MADGNRVYPVNLLVNHHSVGPEFVNVSPSQIRRWFSDVGRTRGYAGVAHSGHFVEGYETFAQAQYAGHIVNNKYGYELIELMDDPLNNVAWHAGNWPVNQRSIGIEHCGNYLDRFLPDKALMCIADTFRQHDKNIGGILNVTFHRMYSATQCPGRIAEQVAKVIDMINDPTKWNEILWPTPPPAPVPAPAPVSVIKKYTRFPEPKIMVTNKAANLWDFNHPGWSFPVVKTFSPGEEFVAIGQAEHSNGGIYYMAAYSFGQADITGSPAATSGVNKVDLSEKPQPVPTPVPTPEPTPIEEPITTPEPKPEAPQELPEPQKPVEETSSASDLWSWQIFWQAIVEFLKRLFKRG